MKSAEPRSSISLYCACCSRCILSCVCHCATLDTDIWLVDRNPGKDQRARQQVGQDPGVLIIKSDQPSLYWTLSYIAKRITTETYIYCSQMPGNKNIPKWQQDIIWFSQMVENKKYNFPNCYGIKKVLLISIPRFGEFQLQSHVYCAQPVNTKGYQQGKVIPVPKEKSWPN